LARPFSLNFSAAVHNSHGAAICFRTHGLLAQFPLYRHLSWLPSAVSIFGSDRVAPLLIQMLAVANEFAAVVQIAPRYRNNQTNSARNIAWLKARATIFTGYIFLFQSVLLRGLHSPSNDSMAPVWTIAILNAGCISFWNSKVSAIAQRSFSTHRGDKSKPFVSRCGYSDR
jgi:hypothetical protein